MCPVTGISLFCSIYSCFLSLQGLRILQFLIPDNNFHSTAHPPGNGHADLSGTGP